MDIIKRIRRGDHVSEREAQSLFGRMSWADILDAYHDAEERQRKIAKTRKNVYGELKKKFANYERKERDREMMERENDAARMTRMVNRNGINRSHLGAFTRKLREVKEKERRQHKNISINAVVEKAFKQTKQDLGLIKEEEKVKPRRLPKHLRNAAKAAAAANTATSSSKTQKKRR